MQRVRHDRLRDAGGAPVTAGAEIRALVTPGATFDTRVETGCIVTSTVDVRGCTGAFDALDSDGFECQFHVDMITRITPAAITAELCDRIEACLDDDASAEVRAALARLRAHVGAAA